MTRGVALTVLLAGLPVQAADRATVLAMDRGYISANAGAIANGVVAGAAEPSGQPYRPAVWEGSSWRFRPLTYAVQSQAAVLRGTDGTQHVGFHYYFNPSRDIDRTEATLWEGEGFTSLHQPSWESSDAFAVLDGVQGGVVVTGTGDILATLWHGTAASAASLHPSGYDSSSIVAMAPGAQVGVADVLTPQRQLFPHAAWWSGTTASFVDLHPAGEMGSILWATDGFKHSGTVIHEGIPYAALWTGTDPNPVSLHPAGFADSEAHGVRGGTQVGFGTAADGFPHALAWRGSASSVIDLHEQLPPGYELSQAFGIDEEGNVVGQALDVDTTLWVAVLWKVPVDALRLSPFLPPVNDPASPESVAAFGSVVPVKIQAKEAKGGTVGGLTMELTVVELGPAAEPNANAPGVPVLTLPLVDHGVYDAQLDTSRLKSGTRYRLLATDTASGLSRTVTMIVR